MASDLMFDLENHLNQHRTGMNNDTGDICIDQDGEWDISLFDELEDMGDADELLRALEDVPYVGEVLDLDLDLDLGFPPWNSEACGDTSSSCTEADMSVDSFSPNPTLSSVSSPGSVEAPSPYGLSDELLSPQSQPLSPESQPSPASRSPERFISSKVTLGRKPQRRANQSRVKSSQPLKRPIQLTPKVSIQPKPVITAMPIPHSTAPLQAKTIIIQPLQAVLPGTKPPPVTIHPAPPAGRPLVLPQPANMLHLRSPQMAQPILTFPDCLVAVPTLSQDGRAPAVTATRPVICNTAMDGDTNVEQRQQRMIKNRESASQSRKKKKEYLLTLEARLKVALSENEKLKCENGSLKKQLEGLVTENGVLKATAPKRRTVCLLVVLVFLMMNAGPLRLLRGNSSSKLSAGTMNSGRHLLGVSPDGENLIGRETPETTIPQAPNRYVAPEKKALMVVKKEPLFLGPPPPCQPSINRTKSIKMAHELRGWVHRHEVERTKTRRMTNSQPKIKTILKSPDEKAEVAQIVSVQYTDMSEKSQGSELQVYYAPHRSHYDFFEEIHRRGDTFYVVSFRRDHLLLPATNHNKRSRPKMSVVLPAMDINDSVIKDKEYETMMQIDCEVMDTRILHIKSSSIPPFLRVNHTDSSYHSGPVHGQATPPVGVLTGSA
ncbi:cyclic AMP-dependent transcription factor ATF-6 alpha [Conger conger]|uniref:cyclic AMP-dependent transcription factor ATF-6 alpha n=1 Tax=Conger conger TaxID=82655 RepID=UPI002A5A4F62|nr:cyclic AMP-dependent transcription factor ATF-6 alpha [Conger conger]